MALFNTPKKLGQDAAKAHAAGRHVFATRFIAGNILAPGATANLPTFEDHITEIEQAGWRLDKMTANQGKNDWAEIYCLFRRQ